MKDLPNIEPSAFRKGDYVGYAKGAWRIRKRVGGGWSAFKQDGTDSFHCRYLSTVSDRLSILAARGAA